MKKIAKKAVEKAFRAGYLVGYPVAGLILHRSHRVRVVIISKGSILLVRSTVGDQKWGFPGGGIHKDESIKSAAIREVSEETNVTLVEEELDILAERVISDKRSWPKVTLTYILASLEKPATPHVSRPLEILEAKWFSLNQLPKNISANVEIGLAYLEKSPKTNLRVLK